jgi:hypothetical protein
MKGSLLTKLSKPKTHGRITRQGKGNKKELTVKREKLNKKSETTEHKGKEKVEDKERTIASCWTVRRKRKTEHFPGVYGSRVGSRQMPSVNLKTPFHGWKASNGVVQ